MHHEQITLEVDYGIRGRLQFGLLEMIDPDTWAVVFRCRPELLN